MASTGKKDLRTGRHDGAPLRRDTDADAVHHDAVACPASTEGTLAVMDGRTERDRSTSQDEAVAMGPLYIGERNDGFDGPNHRRLVRASPADRGLP